MEHRGRTPEELNGPSLLSEVTELARGLAFDVENVSELPDVAARIGAEVHVVHALEAVTLGSVPSFVDLFEVEVSQIHVAVRQYVYG